jgi:hypothetical protein
MLQIPADLRVHLSPAYMWEMLEARMRVDERVRKSVVFIGVETDRGFLPYGTALIGLVVFAEDEGGGYGNTVIVTARHVVDQIPGDTVFLRVNRRDGTSDIRKLPKEWLITFTDRAVDLCVLPTFIDPSIYDIFAINLRAAEWEKYIAELGDPEPGDEVCVVGLYTTHYGHVQNMPVVRIGNIAALPAERVMTDVGYVYGYLIECYSIAGLSGSPVFWTVSKYEIKDGQVMVQRAYLPLGILIGYHVVESKEDEIVVPQFQAAPDSRTASPQSQQREERRTGFAVVLPINHIFRIFESEKMTKILKEAADDLKKKSGFRRASAGPLEVDLPSSDANPTHLEDFNRLVDVAARKRPQGDQT